VLNSFEDAMHLDQENGDTLWADAHADEMETIGVAFKLKFYQVEPKHHLAGPNPAAISSGMSRWISPEKQDG